MEHYLKFRQPLFKKNKFYKFHYWGFIDGKFIKPLDDVKVESQQCVEGYDSNDGIEELFCWRGDRRTDWFIVGNIYTQRGVRRSLSRKKKLLEGALKKVKHEIETL